MEDHRESGLPDSKVLEAQFRGFKCVRGFSDDGAYAFLDGENTGVPVGELEVGEASATPPPLPPPFLRWTRTQMQPPAQGGGSAIKNDVYSLDGGGEVVITWPAPFPAGEIEDIKNWLKIVERKIARSVEKPEEAAQ